MTARFAKYVGVDFSASVTAGRSIWIAVGVPAGRQLAIDRLLPARHLPGGGIDRDHALAALRHFIADRRGAFIGLDFPFGLPAAMVREPDWRGFVLAFKARFPDAESFRTMCRAETGGREVKRRTDHEARTPFCAFNLRVYRQTWWGITEILAPLLAADVVSVPPMVPVTDSRPALAEICPASTLKRLGLYPSYKAATCAATAARATILDRLEAEGVLVPDDLTRLALSDPGGDALDALIAAFATWQVSHDPGNLDARDDIDRIEARVLF